MRCNNYSIKSPSLRGRGLKLLLPLISAERVTVALFTRAWIETIINGGGIVPPPVALFTRAWIETGELRVAITAPCVALFTRAWIETISSKRNGDKCESPSLRGRGLKLLKAASEHQEEYGRPLYEGVD